MCLNLEQKWMPFLELSTYYWFEPNKVGEYEVLCAEYCGVGHYAMRAKVIVESEE